MEYHIPVLLKETIEGLDIHPDGTYVDCTVGGGGHTKEILKRLDKGKVIAIDQDAEALDAAKVNLAPWTDRVLFVHENYSHLDAILTERGIDQVQGILMDLGVSSHQLDEGRRGFSFHQSAPLDMRMDQEAEIPTAKEIVNSYSEEDLTRIFYDYGEERWAKRIAEFIVEARSKEKIERTDQLVNIIKASIPKKARQNQHPARKVFQALRIEVNHELQVLEQTLQSAVDHLAPRGRICVITFHSLEDRIVKDQFKKMATDCLCPPELPVCVCGHRKEIKLVNRRPISAGAEEGMKNPRARSAKLRIAEKLEG